MVRQSLRQRVSNWMFSHSAFAILLAILFVGIELAVFLLSEAEAVQSRMFGTAVIFLIIGLALFDNLFETGSKARAWGRLAEQTGLRCETGNFFLGYSVQVVGRYRERNLTLYSYKRGKGQIPSTRIEVTVKNEAKAVLRLRGPFNENETATDKVTSDLFGSADARLFGEDKRFFIRSNPIHLVTSMFRSGPLRDELLQLRPLANIELEGKTLYFEQIGTIEDVGYLHFLIDLLSNLADAVERGGYVVLGSKAA